MKNSIKAILIKAFPHTIPVLSGYLFLGAAFGLLMINLRFSPWLVFVMSCFIYAGSAQFVTATLLIAPFQPVSAFLIILILNARHIFYGLAMYKRYVTNLKVHPYLIFGLTDETFSILSSIQLDPQIDKNRFYLTVTLLHQLYWVGGSMLGAWIGIFQNTQIKGLEFVLTALFLVLFIENVKNIKSRKASLIGLSLSIVALIIFGSTHFVLASMIGLTVIYLWLSKSQSEQETYE